MIQEVKERIKSILVSAIDSGVPPQFKIPVEIPTSIEQYKLSHPIGAYLVIYKGSTYRHKDVKKYCCSGQRY